MFPLSSVVSAGQELTRAWTLAERLSLQNTLSHVLPGHRASACLRHRLGGSGVSVSTTPEGRTRLGGLMVCAAHHVCPVCHHKKMAHDRARVEQLVGEHYERGGFTVDCVLTIPHGRGDALVDTLDLLERAWTALRGKALWRRLADDLGIVGLIRRFEVTLSENGWHPHFHVSLLCNWAAANEVKGHSRQAVLDDVHALVAGAWAEAGRKIVLAVSLHAQAAVALVSAADGLKAVGYNTKNLGYSNKRGSLTPFDLLRIVDQSKNQAAVRAAKRLFREYADAVKGKHALTFAGVARPAKAAVAVAAVEPKMREEEDRLGIIAPAGWSAIVKAGLREAVAEVKARGELEGVVLLAALSVGNRNIPSGWLVLAEAKSVIAVKGSQAAESAEA